MQRLNITLLLLLFHAVFMLSAQTPVTENTGALMADTTASSDSLTHILKEVVVTARQPATRLVGNSLVSTIAGTPLAELGNALDVLAQLPLIKVTDDDVSVHGKGTPLIYVDNRPVVDNFDLRSLRSHNIKKVELIMAPGAEYDAATGAVLKISTRRTFIEGLTLEEEMQGKKARTLIGSELLTLRYFFRDGTELFATGTAAHNDNVVRGQTVNTLDYLGRQTVVGSSQFSKSPSNNLSGKIGFNHCIGQRSFGAWYKMLHEHGNFLNRGSEWIDNDAPVNREISRRILGNNHYAQAYYDDTYSEKYHLHFDGTFVSRNSRNSWLTSYDDPLLHPDVPATQKRRSELYGGKLTLDFPLGRGRFVGGTEDSYTTSRLDYRMLNEEVGTYIPSSESKVSQTSLAGFASYGGQFGRLSLSAGLRYEYRDFIYRLNGERDRKLSRRDNFLTPDFSAGYGFKDDGSAMLSLSYKSFTELPPYSQLTDGLSYTGMHEIEGGNPALRDGYSHQVSLMGMAGDFMLQAVFRRSLDTYGFVKRVYPADDLQLLFQPVNFNVSAAWIYLMWQKRIGNWQPSLTLGANPQWLELEGEKYDKPICEWYFDNTFTLPWGMIVTANLYGQSSGYIHTQRFRSKPIVMDASVKKSILNKSLSVKLSANNIFNFRHDGWQLRSYGVDMRKTQSYDNRYISLTIRYTFQPRKSSYKGEEAAPTESSRL